MDANQRDLYFKVDKKKKEKDISVIYLFSTQPNADILARDSIDNGQTDKGKSFLNNLVPSIDAHNLEVQINAQQDILKKSQKKQNNLKNEQGDLEKKLRKIQDDLAQNKIDQAAQTQSMQNTVNQDADATKKANKKMSKLLDEQSSLEKKQRNTQQDLADNKKDQDVQQKEVEKQQEVLDALTAKRKS
jgi:chromosome segregation ATPase